MYGVNGPKGFIPYRSLSSSEPFCKGTNLYRGGVANDIFNGDMLRANTGGFVLPISTNAQAAATTLGAMQGASYTLQKDLEFEEAQWWDSGQTLAANTDLQIAVSDDPFQVYTVQADADPGFQNGNQFQNANLTGANIVGNLVVGDTTTGTSAQTLDVGTADTTATLLMRIIGLTAPGFGGGNKNRWSEGGNTFGYNNVDVIVNQHFYKQTTGL